MRASVFILIFSLLSFDCIGFKINGVIPEKVTEVINLYAENNEFDKIEEVLKGIGIFNYELDDKSLNIFSSKTLRSIEVNGNFNILTSTLKSNIGFYEGMPLYLDTLVELKNRVEKFYRKVGFLDVNVNSKLVGNKIVFDVEEGELYVMNSYYVVEDGETKKNIKYSNPKVINEDILNELKGNILEQYRKKGYFNVSADIFYNKSKRRFLFDINYPMMTIFSGILFLHKNVDVSFVVTKGEHYDVKTDSGESDTILEILSKTLEKTDSYHVGIAKYNISKEYNTQNVNIDIKDKTVTVSMFNPNRKKVIFQIITKDNFDQTPLIEELQNLKYSEISTAKDKVYTYVEELGFLSPFVNIDVVEEPNNFLCRINVDAGKKYHIKDVYLNGNLIIKGLNTPYSKETLGDISLILKGELENNFYFTYITLEKTEILKNNAVNLYYKSDNSTYSIDSVISMNDRLSKKIRKLFSKNEKLTVQTLNDVRFYLKNSLNIHNFSFTVIKDNSSAILALDHVAPDKNQIYFSVKYDNLDGVTGTLGYNRYDFLGSSFVLSTIFSYSSKQNEIFTGVYRFDRIKKIRLKYGPAYMRQFSDEGSFDVLSKKYYLGAELFFKNITLDFKILSEYLKTFNSEVDGIFYPKNANMLRLPVSLSYFKKFNNLKETSFGFKLMFNNFLSNEKYHIVETGSDLNFRTALFLKFYTDIRFSWMMLHGKSEAVPLSDRYALGGTSKMKAFSYRELGPADSEGDVYGGKNFVYGSLGFPYKISKYLFIGPFFELAKIENSKVYKDLGVSMDVPTPVGAISIYYAKSFKSWGKDSDALYVSFVSNF